MSAPSAPTLIALDPASSLCTTGHPALVMYGVVLRLLQLHFSSAENLIFGGAAGDGPGLEGFLWRPEINVTASGAGNARTTGIKIEPVWDFKTEDVQRRPGLFVAHGDLVSEKITIGQGHLAQTTKFPDGRIRQVLGEGYVSRREGSVLVFCVGAGNNGEHAAFLAGEVFEFFSAFAPHLRREMDLDRLDRVKMGQWQMLKACQDQFGIPVSFEYQVHAAWRLEKVAPLLKAIDIDTASS